MATIVDFEQDPDAPFGSGNFRDETGKIMYVHDPDTASQFVKTLPGRGGKKQVADESAAIAKGVMGAGAPAALPDQRLALNDTGQPVPAGDPNMSAPPPPMPATSPVTGTDAATPLSATPGEQQSLMSEPEKLVSALGNATAKAPSATPAAAPTGPKQLVDALGNATAKPGSNLPVSGVQTTRSSNVVRGRNAGAVDQQIATEEAAGAAGDENLLETGRQKDAASAGVLDVQAKNLGRRSERETQRIAAAEVKRKTALADKAKVEAALKKNDESLDPDHFMKSMSTGKTIGMVLLAALNGGFGAMIGQKDNGVMQVIQSKIDADIDRQKQEIASGRIRMGNQINEFMQQGHDADTAELLARDRLDAAVDSMAELEAKRLGIQGENLAQAQQLVSQRREQRAARRGDLLSQKESKVQEATSEVVSREQPKPVAAGATVDDALKLGQLKQQRLAEMDALEVAKVLGHTDADGNPRAIANDRAKVVIDGAKDLAVKMPRFEVAENRLRQALKELGVPLEAYNAQTGVIEWSRVSDLRGVGPIDSRPGLKEGPIGIIATETGLTRPDTTAVRDALIGVQEDLTYATTGASATHEQQATFRTQSGQDMQSEDSVKANLSRTAQTLATQRNAMLSGDKDATKLYQHTLNRSPVKSLKPGVN